MTSGLHVNLYEMAMTDRKEYAMSKWFRIIAIILISFILSVGCGSKEPRSHYEKAGAFSYDPPAGWQVSEFPGLKYKVAFGPRENEFTPNINVVDEAFPGTLAAYVEANLKNMQNFFVNLTILAREEFITFDNNTAVKLITENEQQRHRLRQTFFFIGSGKRMYVITCSSIAEDGDRFDNIFDDCVRTFRMH